MKIIVVGYPRSGNTWLARLIGNVLQAPVTGVKKALPLAQEGLDRKSPHRVFQLHMRPHRGPCDHRQAIVSAASFCLDNWRDERVAFIVRDPRDVAVSAAAYWRQKLDVTVRRMADAKHPMPFGPWEKFVLAWADVQDDRLIRVRYEAPGSWSGRGSRPSSRCRKWWPKKASRPRESRFQAGAESGGRRKHRGQEKADYAGRRQAALW